MTILEYDKDSIKMTERIITSIMEKINEDPIEAKYIIGKMLQNEEKARKILEDIIEVTSSEEILFEVDEVLDDTFLILSEMDKLKGTGEIGKFRAKIKRARTLNPKMDNDTAWNYIMENKTILSAEEYIKLLKALPKEAIEKLEKEHSGFLSSTDKVLPLPINQALAVVTSNRGLIKEMAKSSRSEIRKEVAKRTDIEIGILERFLTYDRSDVVLVNAINNKIFNPTRKEYERLFERFKKESRYTVLSKLLEKEVVTTKDLQEALKILPEMYVTRYIVERLAKDLSESELYALYKTLRAEDNRHIHAFFWDYLAEEYKGLESIKEDRI